MTQTLSLRRATPTVLLCLAALLLTARPGLAQTPADSAWNAGRREAARFLYSQQLESNPRNQRALLRLGLLEAWDGNYAASLRLLDQVIALNPERLDAVVARGRVLAWSGKREAAIDTLRGTLKQNPTSIPALTTLAAVLTWEGRDTEALPLLEEAARLQPENPETRRTLTLAQLRAGERSEARAGLLSALEETPNDPDALSLLGDLYLAVGQEGKAVDVFQRLLPLRAFEGHRGLARALARQGSLVASERHWREAVRLAPENPEPRVGLAQVLRWQGRDAAAAQALEEARKLDPGAGAGERPWVHRRLGPQTSTRSFYAEDSDGNNFLTTTARASFRPVPRWELSGRWLRADHELQTGNVDINRDLNAFAVRSWVQIEPGVEVWGEAGRAFYDTPDGEDLTTVAGGISSPHRERFTVGLDFSRAPISATAVTIRQRARRNRIRATSRWRIGSAWTLRTSGSYSDYQGSVSNKAGSGSLELLLEPVRGLEVGFAGNAFGFRDDVNDGYFDPEFYGKLAAPFRYRAVVNSFIISLEATPGARRLERQGQPGNWAGTVDASFQLIYRLAPGREFNLGGIYSRSGGQAFASGNKSYQYGGVQGGLTWTF